jgi:hypothetical protein
MIPTKKVAYPVIDTETVEDVAERNRKLELEERKPLDDMPTLFDLSEFDAEPAEPVIERYVVVVSDEDGKSYWRREKQRGCYATDSFVEIDTTKPIPIRGVKLPTLYALPKGARNKVSDLYRRHKDGGDGINIWVQRWERKESETHWTAKEGFK